MPLVSADAESASAMRMTLSAIGTVCISIYSGKAFSFYNADEKAHLVSIERFISFISSESVGKNLKTTEHIIIILSGI